MKNERRRWYRAGLDDLPAWAFLVWWIIHPHLVPISSSVSGGFAFLGVVSGGWLLRGVYQRIMERHD